MQSKVEILPLSSVDASKLAQFLRRSYPESPLKADSTYREWRWQKNPLGSTLENGFFAQKNEEIIGAIGAMRDQIQLDGRGIDAIWLHDLFVDPAHRESPAVLGLMKACVKSSDVCVVVGANSQMERLYAALGWKCAGQFEQMFYVIDPAALLRTASADGAEIKPILKLGARVVGPIVKLKRVLATRSAVYDRSDISDSILTASQDLARSMTQQGFILSDHSPEFLRWKLVDRPAGKPFCIRLKDEKGIAIMREKERPGLAKWLEVVDLLFETPEDAHRLAHAIGHDALASGYPFVRSRCSLPSAIGACRRAGWMSRAKNFSNNIMVKAKDKEIERDLLGTWHLTGMASDGTDSGSDEASQ